jgi:heat shock protein HtpX
MVRPPDRRPHLPRRVPGDHGRVPQSARHRGHPADLGRPRVLVVLLSLGLYALTAAILVAGVWLLLFRFPGLTLLPGLFLIGVAVELAPRFGRVGRHETVLAPEEAPALRNLVTTVATTIQVGQPHLIVLDHTFNASAAAVGLRRRRVLRLGLGLWGVLAPQQRIALLAHELGHFGNGDVRRGLLTQPAMTTLGRLADLFQPGFSLTGRSRRSIVWIAEAIVGVLARVLVAFLEWAHLTVLAVALRDVHRSEYFADRRAAEIAGSAATVELLDLMVTPDAAWTVIGASARAQETERGWRAAVTTLRADQAPRRPRLRQLSMRRETSLIASHPPTGLRVALVEAAPWCDPALRLRDDESDRIDAELAGYYKRFRRDIAHSGA